MSTAEAAILVSSFALAISVLALALNFRQYRRNVRKDVRHDAERFHAVIKGSGGTRSNDTWKQAQDVKVSNNSDRVIKAELWVWLLSAPNHRTRVPDTAYSPGARLLTVMLEVPADQYANPEKVALEAVLTDVGGKRWWYDEEGRLQPYSRRIQRQHAAAMVARANA